MTAKLNDLWFTGFCVAILIACGSLLTGCPPSNGGGDVSVELRFDDGDPITVSEASPVTHVVSFDITSDLPSDRVGSIDITLAAGDVEPVTVGAAGAMLRVSLTVASSDAADACSSGVEVAAFDVDLQSNGAQSGTRLSGRACDSTKTAN